MSAYPGNDTLRILAAVGDRPVTALIVAQEVQLPLRVTQTALRLLDRSGRVYRLRHARVLLEGHWYNLYAATDSLAARRDRRGLVYEPDLFGPLFNQWLAQA